VTALLRTEGIMKAYGGVQALNGATIAVEEGTVAGLIGPNGSGKTTLFNSSPATKRPDAGAVCSATGRSPGSRPTRCSPRASAGPFQLTRIFPRLTVIENMLIAAQGKDRPRNLLAWFGRDAWTHHRRHALELLEFVGIDRHAEILAGSLSYGQRKLLELAYVLVADPAVILLDEPAGGVNPTLINLIADRIRLLNAEQGRTFLLVEHNMEFVMGLCSTITVLESGADVVSGPPDICGQTSAYSTPTSALNLDEDADLEEETALTRGRADERAAACHGRDRGGLRWRRRAARRHLRRARGAITCVVGPTAPASPPSCGISGLLAARLGTVRCAGRS